MKLASAICVSIVALSACAKKQPSPPETGGGMDGGGGTFIFHSREEVTRVANQVWTSFALKRADNPLAVAYDGVVRKEDAESVFIRGMLRKIMDLNEDHGTIASRWPNLYADRDLTEDAAFSFTEYVSGKTLEFSQAGFCDSPEHTRSAAAVSRRDRQGSLCLSVPALMQTATSGIQGDLIALFAHELGHLNGYGEEDCKRLQRYFLNGMPTILRRSGSGFKLYVARELRTVVADFRYLLTYAPIDGRFKERVTTRLFLPFLKVHGLISKPFSGDELDLTRPELSFEVDAAYRAARAAVLKFSFIPLHGDDYVFTTYEQALEDIRDAGVKLLEFERLVAQYFYGDDTPYGGRDEDQQLLLEATDPKLAPLVPALSACVDNYPQGGGKSKTGDLVGRIESCLEKVKDGATHAF